jgi:hypothetical protein
MDSANRINEESILWGDGYHNGGVHGQPLQRWYDTVFLPIFVAQDLSPNINSTKINQSVDSTPRDDRDVCYSCQLCVNGSFDLTESFDQGHRNSKPGVDVVCSLLKKLRRSEVEFDFALRTVLEARQFQERAIDAFVEVMPEHFGSLRPVTALEAENHYTLGRHLRIEVNKSLRANAWLHFENFRAYIRLNFVADFLPSRSVRAMGSSRSHDR